MIFAGRPDCREARINRRVTMKVRKKELDNLAEIIVKWIYIIVVYVFIALFYGYFVLGENIANAILAAGIILIFILFIRKYMALEQKNSTAKIPFVLFLLTFITRYSYCNFAGKYITQVSDFALTLSEAQSGLFTDALGYYRFYLHKFLYPFILHTVHMRSQPEILFFQCICVSLCAVVIYYIGLKAADYKAGILAAAIYIMWPAQIVYTQIITEEHIAALLMAVTVLGVICIFKRLEAVESFQSADGKIAVIESCIAGGAGGLCAFFKDWALVIYTALIICAIYALIRFNKAQRVFLCICVLIIFFFRGIVQGGITYMAEAKLQIEANNGVIIIQMYATLDPNASGGYNEALNSEYAQMAAENNFDFEETNRIALGILKEKISRDFDKLPELLLRKGKDAYANDDAMFWWALEAEAGEEFKSQFPGLYPTLIYLDNIFYTAVVLCMIACVFFTRNKYIFFILLCILGGGMVSLLVESQGRYKYSIEPLWCLPSAYAICSLCRLKAGTIVSWIQYGGRGSL